MGLMGKTHIGHGTGIFEDYVEIDGKHILLSGEALPRLDQILIQRFDPIDDTGVIPREILHSFRWVSQNLYRIITGIVYAVFRERDDLSFGLKMKASAPYRGIIISVGIASRGQARGDHRAVASGPYPPPPVSAHACDHPFSDPIEKQGPGNIASFLVIQNTRGPPRFPPAMAI